LTGDTRVDKKETELLCFGNAIVDVFANDGSCLALRYGLCEPVQHVEIEKLKTLLSELGETTVVSGGGAANAAKIAGLLGAKVSFAGAIGSDNFGRLFGEELKAAGVKTLLAQKSLPTGICLVLRTADGTRIAASPSAALELSEDDINEEEIRKAKVVVIDGFMLGRRALVRRILALATQHGAAAAIDIGSAAIAAEEAEEIASYVASSNTPSFNASSLDVSSNATSHAKQHQFFLFMNEDEAVSFRDTLNQPTTELVQVRKFFKSLTEKSPSLVIVVKMGKRGAVCFAKGKAHNAGTDAAEPVETTGAGDAFCGAFLTAWARGYTLPECAVIGNKTARIVLDGAGTKVDKDAFKNIAALWD
jgi:sugar/nucleoside kinase (ribokinase family)